MLDMGRPLRVDIQEGWYHVMNRGVARQATFHCDADRVEYGRLLGVGHERFGVEVHAYCLMPNHYHLLLHCPLAGLSAFMHQLGSVYTRHVNDRIGRDGPLFRGRFHSIPITDDRQLLATVRYIHRNALDVAGVTSPTEYRWSSHRAYLGHRRRAPWLRTDAVLSHFDGDIEAFADFVETDGADGAEHRRTQRLVSFDVLLATVDLVLEEVAGELDSASQGVRRTVLILIADRLDEPTAKELLDSLRFAGPDARAAAIRRAWRRANTDGHLWDIAERVLELTYTMGRAHRERQLSA
jgi:REP element-mobilizing transposase RayT